MTVAVCAGLGHYNLTIIRLLQFNHCSVWRPGGLPAVVPNDPSAWLRQICLTTADEFRLTAADSAGSQAVSV